MKEERIVLGGGCFWCIEAILVELKGVVSVMPGYAGGSIPNPTYDQVCSGITGHAEVVEVVFHPEVISLHDILTIFFTLHDPTTVNRQGNDTGTQYRSIIFYSDNHQQEVATQVMKEITESGIWDDKLVTEVKPLDTFYPAEAYHQQYFERNANQPYCQVVIAPKVAKLRRQFQDKLRM